MRIKPVKTPSIMQSHCLCDAGFVDKMKYLLCNFLVIFGNHTEFRIERRTAQGADVYDKCMRPQNMSRAIANRKQ